MRLAPGTRFSVDAVLFDMDGTLVDSTAVVERVWRRWSARHGIDPDAILAVSHGRRGEETIRQFAPPDADVDAEVAWLSAVEGADRTGIVPVRGAVALMAALPPDRVAVVTSAPRTLAASRLALVGLPVPAVLVAADDVAHGKPDPEGYLRAAERLATAPARCLVVEDAPAGLTAGRAAGAQVLALATTLAAGALESWDWVPDLDALRVVAGEGAGAVLLEVT